MKKIASILLIILFLCPCVAVKSVNAKEYASFSSFYKESTSWGKWALAGGAALGTGLVVFFTGGAASPLVAPFVSTVGGWLGAAGLSGAAATSSGLALLGGGSIASGGLGMAGGAAVYSTVVSGVIEAGALGYHTYQQNAAFENLSRELKKAPNFPPFINDSGPDCIAEAKEILDKKYDSSQLPTYDANTAAIKDAIWALNRYRKPEEHLWSIGYDEKVRREKLRVYALKALLQFMIGENEEAYENAGYADSLFEKDDGSKDLILFIRGTSGLLTKKIDLRASDVMVSGAIGMDKESPFLPLLFSIYLSRVEMVEMASPQFIKSFANNLYGISEDCAPACYAFVGMAIMNQLQQLQNEINIWKENAHMLTKDNIDNAIEFCTGTYASFTELVDFAKGFGQRIPDPKAGDSGEAMGYSFRKTVSQYKDSENELQNVITFLKDKKVEIDREAQAKPEPKVTFVPATDEAPSILDRVKNFFKNLLY